MNKPKLLALFPSYHSSAYHHPVGGGEISNRLLLEGLVSRGWDVSVVSCNTDIFVSSGGVKVYKTNGFDNRVLSIVFQKYFLKKLSVELSADFKPDVIVCGPTALAYARDVSVACGARFGLVVRAFENFKFLTKPQSEALGFIKGAAKWFLGNYQAIDKPADFYIFNSEYMKGVVSPHVNGNGYVVYPSVDIPVKEKKINEVKNVHMVGLSRGKGFGVLQSIANRFPKLIFSIYGKRDGLIGDDQLPSNVCYRGWANTDEIYGNADVFLVPSQVEEAFGRVSVEALAHGCIVLVSDRGGLPETVDFDDRFIIDAEAPDSWCSVIDAVINNSHEFVDAARHARKKIKKYNSDNQVFEFEKALFNEMS
jgi:glycosyltransferase involved in cell wall biosynthesis